MKSINIAITAASFCGNKGAAAMLQSGIKQLKERYGDRLEITLMSTYPKRDREIIKASPERYDFINVVNAKPEKLLFLTFPLAVMYGLFGHFPLFRRLFLRNKIIRAYSECTMVVDMAGVSFVDSRGFVMNTYAFVCAAVPMLCGAPVCKYSQALGSFKNPYNRFLANRILPKMRLICARGEITKNDLTEIGITKNVRLCADGAFSMPEGEEYTESVKALCDNDSFYNGYVVGVSISSVVEKRCRKLGINYKAIMTEFIERLTSEGYSVLIIANAAREDSAKPRNNDLPICGEVYANIHDKTNVRYYPREMYPEEIRLLISRCKALVASRFHAMIGALEKGVPVLLVGWSHKYKEVLDMFGLGEYAADYSELTPEKLRTEFQRLIENSEEIRAKIAENLPNVKASSRENIELICNEIDEQVRRPKPVRLLDFNDPDRYIGAHLCSRMGYAEDETIRENAASGGMVTALLCYLLESGKIDGAWVTRSEIVNGKLGYKTFIAVTAEEIRSCSSSVYMPVPLLKHIDLLESFNGRIAVVMVPCQLRALSKILENRPELNGKIALKIGLYCSGEDNENSALLPLKKHKISLENAKRIYYKRGHWRGFSTVVYSDGSEKRMSYSKTICAYKNAYFFALPQCLLCQDQFAEYADISFGDVWLKEMKKNPVKHTSCVIRTERAYEMYRSAVDSGVISDKKFTDEKLLRSQKRALVFKYNCARAKREYFAKLGKALKIDCTDKCNWNHRLAFGLAQRNMRFAEENAKRLEKIPLPVVFLYMCFIRFLLSF
ncbi:MAG: hypothetical protein HDT43_10715 [Ruminococcaceae bacterium]|nr:hypothetical protein [Oscillospiraceae bacterium]